MICPIALVGSRGLPNHLQVYHFSAKETYALGRQFEGEKERSAQWRIFENRVINDYSFVPGQDLMLTIEPLAGP